jgi:ligand-binding sensor domain-containing protein
MKHKRITLFLVFSLFTCFAFLPSCKEKNEDYPPQTWSEYSYTGKGIEARDISTIYYENDHSLWLGAKEDKGLLHHDGYKWNVFDKINTGIDFDSVTSIIRDGNNKLWVGWKNGLAVYDGVGWQNIIEFSGLRVTSVAIEGIGYIRVGIKGESGGIATLQNDKWSFETPGNTEIPSGNINGLVSDNNQVLWLSSADKGIIRLKNAVWEIESDGLPLLSKDFTPITKASDGTVWAGSSASQLIHFFDDTYTLLQTGTSKPITSIVVTDDGSIWCSTMGAGLVKFDGSLWSSFSKENEMLPSDDILYLTAANPGVLLFSTPGGKLYLINQDHEDE